MNVIDDKIYFKQKQNEKKNKDEKSVCRSGSNVIEILKNIGK